MDDSFGKRLKEARKSAGFETADEAIARFLWKPDTYKSHEAGRRTAKPDAVKDYAKKFRVRIEWLSLGSGEMRDADQEKEISHAKPTITPRQEASRFASAVADLYEMLSPEAKQLAPDFILPAIGIRPQAQMVIPSHPDDPKKTGVG